MSTSAALSPEEDRYLSALKLDVDHDEQSKDTDSTKTKQLLSLFFAIVQNSQRKKWATMLEKYLIFPWVKPGAGTHLPQGLLRTPNWQLLVYPLFENLDAQPQQMDEAATAEERRLFQMSMSILSLTHWHCFAHRNKIKTDPESMGSTLHESLDLLGEFAGWYEETCMLGRLMLSSFLTTIQSHLDSWAQDFSHPAWTNLIQTIDVIEYFLFYMPERRPTTSVDNSLLHTHSNSPNFGIHLDSDGLCSDLQLVEKVIAITDQAAAKVAKALNDTNDHDENKSALAKAGRRCQKLCIDQSVYMHKILNYLRQIEEDPKTVSDTSLTDLANLACTRDVHAVYFNHNAKKFKKYLQIVAQMIQELRKGHKYDRSAEIAKDMYSKQPTQNGSNRRSQVSRAPTMATLKARQTDYKDVVPVIRSFRNLPRAPSFSAPSTPATPQMTPRQANVTNGMPAAPWGTRAPPPPPPGYRKSIVVPGTEINITVGGKERDLGGSSVTEFATRGGLPPIISFLNKYNCRLLFSRSVDAELFYTRILFIFTLLYLIYVDRRSFHIALLVLTGIGAFIYYRMNQAKQAANANPIPSPEPSPKSSAEPASSRGPVTAPPKK